MESPDTKRPRNSDEMADREPNRSKDARRVWRFSPETVNRLVVIAGICGGSFIFIFSVWVPTEPGWLVWVIGLAPCFVIPMVCGLFEGTSIGRATGTAPEVSTMSLLSDQKRSALLLEAIKSLLQEISRHLWFVVLLLTVIALKMWYPDLHLPSWK